MHACLPIHTGAKFSLFNDLMKSNLFFISGKGPTVDRTARSINFEEFARYWNSRINEILGSNGTSLKKNQQVYYKLPEQLERHHKVWVHAWAEKATVVSNADRLKPVADLLSSESRKASLPAAVEYSDIVPETLGTEKKGKQYRTLTLLIPQNGSLHHNLIQHQCQFQPRNTSHTAHTNPPHGSSDIMINNLLTSLPLPFRPSLMPGSSESLKSHGGGSMNFTGFKKGRQQKKRCRACVEASCSLMNTCKGSGKATLCICNHPKPTRSRSKYV